MNPETDLAQQGEQVLRNSHFAQLLNLKLEALEHTLKILQPEMYNMYERKLSSLISESEVFLNISKNLEALQKAKEENQ